MASGDERMAHEDETDMEPVCPIADSIDTYVCGHCPNLHILLRDETGTPLAQATVSREMLTRWLTILPSAN